MCLLVIANDLFKMLPALRVCKQPIVKKRSHDVTVSQIYKSSFSSSGVSCWDLESFNFGTQRELDDRRKD